MLRRKFELIPIKIRFLKNFILKLFKFGQNDIRIQALYMYVISTQCIVHVLHV